MGHFYFDESIQSREGFIVGALVYSDDDLDPRVAAAITQHQLVPGKDEFHSSATAANNPKHAALRESMHALVSGCRIGAVVHPASERATLGLEALRGLAKVLNANRLPGKHVAVFDEGIFKSTNEAQRLFENSGLADRITPVFEADSKSRAGLQVADLVAHCCGRMLYEQGAENKKMVKAGENSGYDPDLDLELEFELWARLRYNWFCGEDKECPSDLESWQLVDVASCGLHIAEACSPVLRAAALQRFSKMYLGCIH